DLGKHVPLFSEMAGALWYYRGLKPADAAFMDDLRQSVVAAKRAILTEYPRAKVGIFYSLAYANWISLHRNYLNETSLVGGCELLRDLGLRYAMVSEFNLSDLPDYDLVIVPYNPAISETAARALAGFVQRGGAVILEADAGGFDHEKGKRQREAGTLPFGRVRVLRDDRASDKATVKLDGLGLKGLTIPCAKDARQAIEAHGQVIGTFDDGAPALVLGDPRHKTLYLAWRFFLPYSFKDDAEAKAAKRRLLQAFLAWSGGQP
ncbi:MAG: hypothetical protein FJ278_23145, partial [Planctomycetes bacterium]|nr:hypothetical protein [Planctomycetota bacterium]